MNIKLATATLGAALILAGTPAFAAGMQSGPIHIDNVQHFGGNSTDGNDDTIILPSSTEISFTNEYGVPATDVVFALETDGYVVGHFDDVGSFATGVTIDHRFAGSAGDLHVAVEKATFADGTVWNNPDVLGAPQAQAPAGVEATARF